QAWLLENARLGERATSAPAASSTASSTTARKPEAPRRSSSLPLVAVAAIIGIVLIVIVLVVLSNSPTGETAVNPQPTVTLAEGQYGAGYAAPVYSVTYPTSFSSRST